MAIGYLLFLLFLVRNPLFASADSFCYICDGSTTTNGTDCNLANVCFGNVCVLNANMDSTWTAGCANSSEVTPGTCAALGSSFQCACDEDFCNSPAQFLSKMDIVPVGPEDPHSLTCFECGTVIGQDDSHDNDVTNITCDGLRTCQGVACVTRRSVNPKSYCVSSWDGIKSVGCTKPPGEDELCICNQTLCNYPYDPMTIQFPVTLPPVVTTASPTTTGPVVLPNGTIVCEDGRHFGPNPQTVNMGEKLKSIILNNFGKFAGSEALNQFSSGIDIHICNYQDK